MSLPRLHPSTPPKAGLSVPLDLSPPILALLDWQKLPPSTSTPPFRHPTAPPQLRSNYYTPNEGPSDNDGPSPTTLEVPAQAAATIDHVYWLAPSNKQTKVERAQNMRALGDLIAALDSDAAPAPAGPPGYMRSLTAQSGATTTTGLSGVSGASSTGMPNASLCACGAGELADSWNRNPSTTKERQTVMRSWSDEHLCA